MHTIATRLIARPIAGPTPLASPIAGRTNGNTMYISRHRNVATISDVWKALRAPAADPGGASTGGADAPDDEVGPAAGVGRWGRARWIDRRGVRPPRSTSREGRRATTVGGHPTEHSPETWVVEGC